MVMGINADAGGHLCGILEHDLHLRYNRASKGGAAPQPGAGVRRSGCAGITRRIGICPGEAYPNGDHRTGLSSLEWVAHGAAPCPTYVKRAMIDWWGPIITEYYGGTESGFVTFHTTEEALRTPGTVGRPLADATVRVYGDDGRELPPGEIGEIYVRLQGAGDFTYHGMPDKRREIERNGLISIGDVGYLDEDGYLFLCDRKRDMVISGGVNIYPAEIEAALLALSGVRDCAVFGIPHEDYGEALCAC